MSPALEVTAWPDDLAVHLGHEVGDRRQVARDPLADQALAPGVDARGSRPRGGPPPPRPSPRPDGPCVIRWSCRAAAAGRGPRARPPCAATPRRGRRRRSGRCGGPGGSRRRRRRSGPWSRRSPPRSARGARRRTPPRSGSPGRRSAPRRSGWTSPQSLSRTYCRLRISSLGVGDGVGVHGVAGPRHPSCRIRSLRAFRRPDPSGPRDAPNYSWIGCDVTGRQF